jgi:PAS domain S-box-containing protein
MEDQPHASLLEAIFAADPGCVAVLLGPDLRFAFVNPAYRFILPDTCTNPLDIPYDQIWEDGNPLAIQDRLREVLETGRPYLLKEVEFHFPDRTARFFSLQARRFPWDKELAVLLILWDITERKNAERAVRSIALFPEQNPHPVLRFSPQGILLYANPAAEELLPDMHVGRMGISALVQPVLEVYRLGDDRLIEYVYQARTFAFQLVPVYEGAGYVNLYGRNITDLRRASEALKQSNERLKRAQQMAHLGSWELDLNTDQLTWSDEIYRIFGLQPQEFEASYEAFLEAVHPEDRAAVDGAFSGSIQAGLDSYEIEHRVVRKSTGEVRLVQEKCEHLRDDTGRIVRSIGMVQDITERKQMEQALRESEHKYLTIFQNSPFAIALSRRADGVIIDANQAALDLFGYRKEEALERSSVALNVFADLPTRQRLMDELQRRGSVSNHELSYTTPQGELRYLSISINPLTLGEQDYLLTTIENITPRKLAERDIQQLNQELAQRNAELEVERERWQ